MIITPGFAGSEEETSIVTYFLNYSKALFQASAEFQFTIIALDYPFEKKQYCWFGAEVLAFGLYGKSRWKKVFAFMRILVVLIQKHREKPFSLIHTLWLKQASLLGFVLSRLIKRNCVMTAMGMEFVNPTPYLKLFNTKRSTVVPVSERQAQDSPYEDKRIIPWGVIEQPNESIEKTIDILFVGFLNENKNIGFALEVFSEILIKHTKLNIVVIGDYFNVDIWMNKAIEMQLQKNITFTGKLENESVIEHMKQSKVLVHTSNYESLGYVMLEAMSCGMYVVSKEVGIAKASEHWKLAHSKKEFIEEINRCLEDYRNPGPFVPYNITQTIKEYSELYRKLSKQ